MLIGELEWALATVLTLDLLFVRWCLRVQQLRARPCLAQDAERLARTGSARGGYVTSGRIGR